MPCTQECIILMYQHLMFVIVHLFARLIYIRTEKIRRTAYHRLIGTIRTFTAGTGRTEQIIIIASFQYIGPFVSIRVSGVGSNLDFCCFRILYSTFQRKAILAQLNSPNTIPASPKQVLLAVILDIERVDTVVHANLIAPE